MDENLKPVPMIRIAGKRRELLEQRKLDELPAGPPGKEIPVAAGRRIGQQKLF